MKLLYPVEHVNCFNYSKQKESVIEKIVLQKGAQWDTLTLCNKIIILMEGEVDYIFDGIKKSTLRSKQAITVPIHTHFNLKALTDSTFMVFRLQNKVQLCDRYSLDKLILDNKRRANRNNNKADSVSYIIVDERLEGYISLLDAYISSGMKCTYFLKIKIQELFFLLRAYYPKEELLYFFRPLLEKNSTFSEFVYNNYMKVKSIKELADMANYSLSGFQKHFKKIFGVSAYQWLKQKRSMSIYRELNSTERPLKEISEEYGFSSPSHFNDFCKTQFGNTPGDIRKNR